VKENSLPLGSPLDSSRLLNHCLHRHCAPPPVTSASSSAGGLGVGC
jgi:hypothetical protein